MRGNTRISYRSQKLLPQYASIEPWLKTVTPTPEKEWKQTSVDRAEVDGLYECFSVPAAAPAAQLDDFTHFAFALRSANMTTL
jgi:succinate dehydrogenase/fumarate reductase-like Fe-S protein